MYKALFVIAALMAGIAVLNLQAPPGSRALTEAGFLLLGLPVVLGLAFWARARATRLCPACRGRVAADAARCRHCGTNLPPAR